MSLERHQRAGGGGCLDSDEVAAEGQGVAAEAARDKRRVGALEARARQRRARRRGVRVAHLMEAHLLQLYLPWLYSLWPYLVEAHVLHQPVHGGNGVALVVPALQRRDQAAADARHQLVTDLGGIGHLGLGGGGRGGGVGRASGRVLLHRRRVGGRDATRRDRARWRLGGGRELYSRQVSSYLAREGPYAPPAVATGLLLCLVGLEELPLLLLLLVHLVGGRVRG